MRPKPKRFSKEKQAELIVQIVNAHMDEATAIIHKAKASYRYLTFEGKPTGPNSDSTHWVLLLESNEDGIITAARFG